MKKKNPTNLQTSSSLQEEKIEETVKNIQHVHLVYQLLVRRFNHDVALASTKVFVYYIGN